MALVVVQELEINFEVILCITTCFLVQEVQEAALRASAHNYGPNNGTSRKLDFAHFLPIDWP